MKINTISAYVLVYLLARGHWNLMVPVRADDDPNNSSGSASGDAGSSFTGGSMAGSAGGSGSSSTGRRSKAGSSASSTAGSTAGSDVANLASLGSSAGDGSSAANEGSGTSPDAGQASGGDVLLNGLYPDAFTSGFHIHVPEGGDSNPESTTMVELGALFPEAGFSPVEYKEGLYAKEVLLPAIKTDAMALAEEARKTAEKLKKAAEDMIKQANELTEAAEHANNVEDLAAKMDATAYNVGVARAEAAEDSKPLDMTYYSSFPDGHHYRATDEALIKLYKLDRRANNEMYSDSFPDGWHAAGYGLSDIIISEAKKYRDEKYEKDREAKKQQILAKGEIEAKDNQIANKEVEIKLKKDAVDVKYNQLEVKRREIAELRDVINELSRQLRELENEARVINSDHSKLFANYKLLALDHKKLEEDRAKLLSEHKDLEDEDREIVRDYYQLSGSTKHFDRKYEEREISFDPTTNFPSFTEELGLLEAGKGAVKPKYLGDLNPADTFSEHPLYTGASVSGGSLEPSAEGHTAAEVGVSADASVPLAYEAQPAESVAQVAEPTPSEHVASTPVAAPEAHVAGEVATPLADGTSSGEAKAESGLADTAALRLFKADANGNDVEMAETTDYEKKHTAGDDKYEFKDGVKCTKVMFGEHLLWKKGDHSVDDPKKVGYNGTVNVVVVLDNSKTLVYKMEDKSDNWKHIRTVEKQTKGAGHGRSASHTGSSASAPGSLTTPLAGSTTNLASASTGSGEAEETSSVTSGGSVDNEQGTGLRGA